jgi:O-antigen/teichoic acid export membrane protein
MRMPSVFFGSVLADSLPVSESFTRHKSDATTSFMTEAVGELPSIDAAVQSQLPKQGGGARAVLSKNIAASLIRVCVTSLVALILPAYLTHRLPVSIYGAWALILQLGGYVFFLDLGVQTSVAKFIAEYEARGDLAGASRRASAGFAMMTIAGLLGIALTIGLAWQVPRLFHGMPAALYRDVRVSVLMIGASLAFQLVCSVFGAIFLGLQRYGIPMSIAVVNRVLYTIAVCLAVFLHGSLAEMGFAVAVVNVTTSIAQFVAWRRLASRIRISLRLVDGRVLGQMAHYCALLAIWSIGMVFVSGLDLTIVGHYDYSQTAYYSIAILPTNFVVMIVSSAMGPLMPASSALSTQRTPTEMGQILGRTTRYSTMMLLLTGLPLIICGFPILRLWVGPVYALHSFEYLQILILANILRSSFLPYATMVVATGKQAYGIAAAVSEALVNLGASLYLARHYGAVGVALGTLFGAVTSVALHFAVSMHFTYRTLSISRAQLFSAGILRPGIIAIPSILVFFFAWSAPSKMPSVSMISAWVLATLCIAWFGNLNRKERTGITRAVKGRLTLPGHATS